MGIPFRIGPVLMLIPMGVLGVIDHQLEPYAWNTVYPFSACIVASAAWHLALIVREKGRRLAYLAYAIVYMPLHVVASFFAFITYIPR